MLAIIHLSTTVRQTEDQLTTLAAARASQKASCEHSSLLYLNAHKRSCNDWNWTRSDDRHVVYWHFNCKHSI